MTRHRYGFGKIDGYDPRLMQDGVLRGGATASGNGSGIFVIGGNGNGRLDQAEQAWKLADSWWWGPNPAPAPAAPVTVGAFNAAGDAGSAIRFGPQGFGVGTGRDATLLDAGEGVTFTAADPLAAFSFTAELRLRAGTAVVVLGGGPGAPTLRLEGIRHGDRITVDYAAQAVRVNDTAVDADGFFAQGTQQAVSVASGGGRAFAVGAAVVTSEAPDMPLDFDVIRMMGTAPVTAMAMAGDQDGDGIADLLLAETWTPDSRLQVVSGADLARRGPIDLTDGTTWSAEVAPRTIATLGDVDGDGRLDVAKGGVFWQTRVSVGGARIDIDTTFVAGIYVTQYDTEVSAAGDVDGNGLDDLLLILPTMRQPFVGGQARGGAVFVVFDSAFTDALATGEDTLLLRRTGPEDAVMIRGNREMTLTAAITLGDLDGDGRAELLVQGYRSDWDGDRLGLTGASYVVLGAAVDAARQGSGVIDLRTPNPAAFFKLMDGNATASAGDVDGDGVSEVMMSRFESESWLCFGDSLLAQRGEGWIGFRNYFGRSVFVGDLDGDGRDDLFLMHDNRATLIWGATLAEARGERDFDINGLGAAEAVRFVTRYPAVFNEAAAAGDVDGDGHDDLLLSLGNDVLMISGARIAEAARGDGVIDMALI